MRSSPRPFRPPGELVDGLQRLPADPELTRLRRVACWDRPVVDCSGGHLRRNHLVDDDLPFTVDRSSGVALAAQVADGLRQAAASGALRGGDRLPSSRELANRLGVSRTVVTAAYDQLHAEGWLDGRHGSGTYLTAAPAPAGAHTDGPELVDPLAGLLDLA